jgi:Uma2 family endonuclease
LFRSGLSAEPDIVFLSDKAIDTGRVTLVPKSSGEEESYVEIEGPPDLVVEIVSDSSEKKDTQRLPAAYFAAGVPEFLLVDARPAKNQQRDSLRFEIFTRGQQGYEPSATDAAGFQESAVLHRSFRLQRARNSRGRPVYTLHMSG